MRRALVALVLILLLTATAAFCLSEITGAATGTVSPSVTVTNTISLNIENDTNVQWTNQSAGSHLTGTIQAKISANASWNLTVQATVGYPGTNELTDESHKISSSCFKYTSTAGSPAPPNGSGTATTTCFDGSNQTSVWTDGTATADCRVAITYDLQIPASQPPGDYTATHTYTLVPS
jgi:hypothetical protein